MQHQVDALLDLVDAPLYNSNQVFNRNQDQRYDKPYFVTDNRTFIIETDRYSVSWKWAIHAFA